MDVPSFCMNPDPSRFARCMVALPGLDANRGADVCSHALQSLAAQGLRLIGKLVLVTTGLMATRAADAQQASPVPQTPGSPQVAAAPVSPATLQETLADMRARIAQLERRNQELMRDSHVGKTAAQGTDSALPALPGGPALPSPTLPGETAAGAAATDIVAPPEGGTVAGFPTQAETPGEKKPDPTGEKAIKSNERVYGNTLKASASFQNGLFLWLDSPNKDFTMHIGAWTQLDSVWWFQSPGLFADQRGNAGTKQNVASGARLGGMGNLQDGVYFRRIRPYIEGTFWQVFEYRLIPALENDQYSTVGLDEFWVGMNEIPILGTLRFGHVKNAMGLEADMTASSRTMTFMERSAYSEAIERNENFVTGIWSAQSYFDQRMMTFFALFRSDQAASSGAFFGDGQYGVQGRMTGLPIYQDDGRHLLHLGISGGFRTGQASWINASSSGLPVASPFNTFQLRARPETRDDDPSASPNSAQSVPGANSNRLIDTGTIAAHGQFLMGLELLYILGPFSAQAEYGWNWTNDATGIVSTNTTTRPYFRFTPALNPAQDYMFSGGYVQLAYTLTGENRAYDKSVGTLSRYYYGKRGPTHNAYLVRDANGDLTHGLGAWEVALRYSYVNLCDGSGIDRIQGGRLDGLTVALNWYLNANMNFMIDWVYDNRKDLPAGSIQGYTSSVGAEMQVQF